MARHINATDDLADLDSRVLGPSRHAVGSGNAAVLGLQADSLSASNRVSGIEFCRFHNHFPSSKMTETDIFVTNPVNPEEKVGATISRCLISVGLSPVSLYVDSGAGQCLSCSSTAFAQMLPCQVEITGIAGALQIYGCDTALFLYDDGCGLSVVLRIHNCLYGRGQFNLLSVSQICQQNGNSVYFTLASPALVLRGSGSKTRVFCLPMTLEDGLFALRVTPFQLEDPRYSTLPKVDVTPSGVFQLSDDSSHRWSSKVLLSASREARILVASHVDFDYNLKSFCGDFLAPPSIPTARRQYDSSVEDMMDLTTRFRGLGDDRLRRTMELSNGLTAPASKATSRVSRTKPFSPPGRWVEGKTPRVSKGKIGNLHHASVGEAVCTDTFESGDSKYRYGQAYFDMVSHWGDVFPLSSRTQVGASFVDFCCRN
jgi:hypothetical protein